MGVGVEGEGKGEGYVGATSCKTAGLLAFVCRSDSSDAASVEYVTLERGV